MQERGRFDGSLEITAAVLTYDDGSTRQLDAEGVAAVSLKPADRPNPLTFLQIAKRHFDERGGVLRAAGDKGLATAAKFGVCHAQGSLEFNLEEPAVQVPQIDGDRRVVRAKLDYAVTIRRLADG